MKDNSIVVSCVVLCYNSAQTVLETLDSILFQTYQNIELIISDDGSSDNTVTICRDWMNNNSKRFVRTELLIVDHNTGISANENRAIAACRGEWVKTIAADDKLLPNCVVDFVNYVVNNPESNWVSSRVRKYRNTFDEDNCFACNVSPNISFFDLTAEEQLRSLTFSNILFAPSMFYRLSLKKEIKSDTNYSFEDLPFYVDALEHGVKCNFLDKETVCYRVSESASLSNAKLFKYNTILEFRRFQKQRMFKYMTPQQILCQKRIWKVQDFFEKSGLNRNNKITDFAYHHICSFIRNKYDQK